MINSHLHSETQFTLEVYMGTLCFKFCTITRVKARGGALDNASSIYPCLFFPIPSLVFFFILFYFILQDRSHKRPVFNQPIYILNFILQLYACTHPPTYIEVRCKNRLKLYFLTTLGDSLFFFFITFSFFGCTVSD